MLTREQMHVATSAACTELVAHRSQLKGQVLIYRVKMGPERAVSLMKSGCNDMGGTLMNESITKAAGQ